MRCWYRRAQSSDPHTVPVGSWAGRIMFHGTSVAAAEDIRQNGVDALKSSGGYFGWGFYMAADEALAKGNYADWSDDEEGGAVIRVRIKPDARILDLRDFDDSEVYMKLSDKGRNINSPRFTSTMVSNGIDGLYDNSFGGVVIYNGDAVEPIDVVKGDRGQSVDSGSSPS